MAKRRLPIGIQTFRNLRERNCYYVDKTGHALRLVEEGTHYFLSRPRRFGKSLFLDTLKELFMGSRELFEGLQAWDHWDWSERYPVVHLSFGGGQFSERGYLHTNLMAEFDAIETDAEVERRYDSGPERLKHLLRTLHRRSGSQVVVLVDEYDKPILDALDQPDIARANREYLRGLYSVIKHCDANVRFCFLTGVSKFSKVSLFSGLNNLDDITLDPTFSSICGYTERDLETVFAPELQGLDRGRIRHWYSGYRWGGEEIVYNPVDVLLLLRHRTFQPWWFETGTPTFLVEMLVDRAVPSSDLDGTVASEELLSSFDVGRISTEALLFQTGYLTLAGEVWRGGTRYYRLGYPNREVRQSLNKSLLDHLVGDASRREAHSFSLSQLLEDADIAGLERRFHALFAGIPYQWHSRNDLARYEAYYASVFYSYLAGLGVEVTVEDSTSRGRLDMAVRSEGHVFLFEFKVLEQAGRGAAMAQLKERGYADKYRHLGKPVHLVAVEFSATERNVARFEAELA